MAIHSSILAWKIPCTEEQMVGYSPYDLVTTQEQEANLQHCVSFGCYSTVIHLYRYKFSFIFFPLISSVQSLSRV